MSDCKKPFSEFFKAFETQDIRKKRCQNLQKVFASLASHGNFEKVFQTSTLINSFINLNPRRSLSTRNFQNSQSGLKIGQKD